jgi:hypothetical protein
MARNSPNDHNLDFAAQARELTDAELDCVSGGETTVAPKAPAPAFEIKDWSF